MANPGYSLRFHTHWLSPPVAAIARSGGPRRRTGCPTRVKDHTRASGRAWQQIEGAPVHGGLQLDRDGLVQMLEHDTQLSQQQWEVFGITDLDTNHHVLCDSGHFAPTAFEHTSIELRVWEPWWRMRNLASDLAGARPEICNYTALTTIHIYIYIYTCIFIYIYIYMCVCMSLSLCPSLCGNSSTCMLPYCFLKAASASAFFYAISFLMAAAVTSSCGLMPPRVSKLQ